MITAGNNIYEVCPDCGKYVKMNGLFGGMHFCRSRFQNNIDIISYIDWHADPNSIDCCWPTFEHEVEVNGKSVGMFDTEEKAIEYVTNITKGLNIRIAE